MKSWKKLVASALAILMIAVLLIGCQSAVSTQPADADDSGANETSMQESESTETLKIGLSLFSLTAEYLANLKDNMLAYQEAQGLMDAVEIVILDAESDAAKQLSQVDNLISQQVDAVILVPLDREQLVPAVQACKDAGIPCIELAASTVATDVRTSYIGSDDIVSGRMLMEALAEKMGGKGNLVVLHGITGVNAEVMRHTGMHDVLKDYPDIKIVAEKVCDWDRAKSLEAVENLLQSDINFDAIFAENDEMAMGAFNAVKGSGKEADIIIGGVDAIPDALQSVIDGGLYCTIYQNNKLQAETALDIAIKAARGEAVDKDYYIPYELVTQENGAEYLGK